VPALQAPLWQTSAPLQAFPSLQLVLSGTAGFEQAPVMGSQVPALWQASAAAQTTGEPPKQAPAWQLSSCVQALPSLQGLPLTETGYVQAPVVGSHEPASWHASGTAQATGVPETHTPI
jgi:hypothetical protein